MKKWIVGVALLAAVGFARAEDWSESLRTSFDASKLSEDSPLVAEGKRADAEERMLFLEADVRRMQIADEIRNGPVPLRDQMGTTEYREYHYGDRGR